MPPKLSLFLAELKRRKVTQWRWFLMPSLLAVLLLSLFPSAGAAQARVPSDSVGASAQAGTGQFGHYVVQALVGAGAGWGAGIGLGVLGGNNIGEQGGEQPGLEGFAIAFPVGFVVGTALGVSLTAKAQWEPHSFLGASLGALAGGGLVVATIPYSRYSSTPAFCMSWPLCSRRVQRWSPVAISETGGGFRWDRPGKGSWAWACRLTSSVFP